MNTLRNLRLPVVVALLAAVFWVTAVSMSGCAQPPVAGDQATAGQPVTAANFNAVAADVVTAVTTVRQAATALYQAGKITAAKDAGIQSGCDVIVTFVREARALKQQDPAAAVEQLMLARSQLVGLKTETGVQP